MKAKKEELKVLSVVVDAYTLDDGDCFGKDWQHGHEQCSMCSMQNVCIVLTTKKIEDKVISDLTQFQPFVDEIDFDLVPKDQIASIIQQGTQIPIENLRAVFADKSKCKDTHTVAIQVNMFIRDNSFRVTDGKVTI